MYSAQVRGLCRLERDYLDDENTETHRTDELAKDAAGVPHGWNSLDISSDEDLVEVAKPLAGMRIRAVECLQTMGRAVSELARNQAYDKGAHLSIALYKLAEPGGTLKPKGATSVQVDMPAGVPERPWLRISGRFPMPIEEMVNSPPKDLAEAQPAAPPFPPFLFPQRGGAPMED